jgi:hypothetical protein
MDAPVCAACGSSFLAKLATEDTFAVPPILTRLSRGGRITAALGATVVLLALLAGLFWAIS